VRATSRCKDHLLRRLRRHLKPGSVYSVQDASPCLSGRIGGSATTYVLGGVAIAAGVVGIVVVLTNGDDDTKGGKKKASDDDDQPASP
jgi:hypothetical protein